MTAPTNLADRRRLRKAAAILADDTHPQYGIIANAVDTALELDPPDGWVESDPCDPHGIARPWPIVRPS